MVVVVDKVYSLNLESACSKFNELGRGDLISVHKGLFCYKFVSSLKQQKLPKGVSKDILSDVLGSKRIAVGLLLQAYQNGLLSGKYCLKINNKTGSVAVPSSPLMKSNPKYSRFYQIMRVLKKNDILLFQEDLEWIANDLGYRIKYGKVVVLKYGTYTTFKFVKENN